MPTEDELLNNAKEQAEQEYRIPAGRYAGRVLGIGIGTKFTEDKEVGPRCLRFFVEKKIRPKEAIPDRLRIDREYRGVRTDVVETGRLVSFQARPGSSIGLTQAPDKPELPPNVDPARTATLGAIVRIGDDFYVLGSNHAMAVNGRATGARILFRPPDRFVNDPNDFVLANITNYVRLRQPGPNHVDCALARIEREHIGRVNARFPQQIVTSAVGIDPTLGMKVIRVDDAEEPSGAIVSDNYKPRFDFSFGGYDFEKLILIEGDKDQQPFARFGDSGSVIAGFDNDSGKFRATALVMGGARRKLEKLEDGSWKYKFYTVACPFNTAIAELQKTLPKTLLPGDSKIELVFDLPHPEEASTAAHTELT